MNNQSSHNANNLQERFSAYEAPHEAHEKQADWLAVSATMGGGASSHANVGSSGSSISTLKSLLGIATIATIAGLSYWLWPSATENQVVDEATQHATSTVAMEQEWPITQEEPTTISAKVDLPTAPSLRENATIHPAKEQRQNDQAAQGEMLSNNAEESTSEAETHIQEPVVSESWPMAIDYATFLFSEKGRLLSNGDKLCVNSTIEIDRLYPDAQGKYRLLLQQASFAKPLPLGRIDSETVRIPVEHTGKMHIIVERKNGLKWESIESLKMEFVAMPRPKANFVTQADEHNTFVFKNISKNAEYYMWYMDGDFSAETQPVKVFAKNGKYPVLLYAHNDVCGDSLLKYVEVSDGMLIDAQVEATNILTPNGDGKNDRFILSVTDGNIKTFTIQIKSIAQNKVVFESHDQSITWDGTDQYGDNCANGQYYYTVKYILQENEQQVHSDWGIIHLFN